MKLLYNINKRGLRIKEMGKQKRKKKRLLKKQGKKYVKKYLTLLDNLNIIFNINLIMVLFLLVTEKSMF